jgi:hypothetical protein
MRQAKCKNLNTSKTNKPHKTQSVVRYCYKQYSPQQSSHSITRGRMVSGQVSELPTSYLVQGR